MLVSVIVTTKNEEKSIEDCLQSIKNQNLDNSVLFSDSVGANA